MLSQNLKLYSYWRSSSSWRIRWAMAYKGITYETKTINLLKNEQNSENFILKNPTGTVPCLEIDGSCYGESLAILEWLEETYPTPPLLPTDSQSRLVVRQLANIIISQTQPIQNLSTLKYLSNDSNVQANWAKHWIHRGLKAYETILVQKKCSGTYSFEGQLTIADLCLIPQCYNARRFGLDVSEYPNIARIERNCLKLKSCQISAPDKQSDAI